MEGRRKKKQQWKFTRQFFLQNINYCERMGMLLEFLLYFVTDLSYGLNDHFYKYAQVYY